MTPLLHERFPELRETLPHLALGGGPTPVAPLAGLSEGRAAVWVKDDGAYGDGGWGGNKVRKLEWLLPDVRRRGRGTILTVGGLGTNWGLATALYAREQGLRTVLALVDQPLDEHVGAQLQRLRDAGARLHFTRTKARTIATVPYLLARYRNPVVLPPGGSSPLGALGYAEAALELAAQVRAGALPEPSHIVTAVGSGGTAAGLLLGLQLAGMRTKVVAVVVNDSLRLDARTLTRLAARAREELVRRGARPPALDRTADRLTVVRDFLGPAYGHATPAGRDALDLARKRAGLPLEPVYTAKAMAALLALDAAGSFGDGPVLFLQTNGPR